MRKDKLIKLLQQIEGNPDVLLWNGNVGDWQDIVNEIVSAELVKPSFKSYCDRVTTQMKLEAICRNVPVAEMVNIQANQDKLRKTYNKIDYEFNYCVSEDMIKSGEYKVKKVVLLQPKFRGEISIGWKDSVQY